MADDRDIAAFRGAVAALPALNDGEGPFHCVVCQEDHPPPVQQHQIHGEILCHDCVLEGIIPMFHKALDHEINYPPEYGGKKLHAHDFRKILSSDFMKRWRQRQIEYRTKPATRIYCQHLVHADKKPRIGEYDFPKSREKLALTTAEAEKAKAEGHTIEQCGIMVGTFKEPGQGHRHTCDSCQGVSCASCSEAYHLEEGEHNTCADRPEDKDLEALAKGKDYQECAKCALKCELQDGCNKMHCPRCAIYFCFLCGQETTNSYNHWKPGGCPIYGKPGDAHARQMDEVRMQGDPANVNEPNVGPMGRNPDLLHQMQAAQRDLQHRLERWQQGNPVEGDPFANPLLALNPFLAPAPLDLNRMQALDDDEFNRRMERRMREFEIRPLEVNRHHQEFLQEMERQGQALQRDRARREQMEQEMERRREERIRERDELEALLRRLDEDRERRKLEFQLRHAERQQRREADGRQAPAPLADADGADVAVEDLADDQLLARVRRELPGFDPLHHDENPLWREFDRRYEARRDRWNADHEARMDWLDGEVDRAIQGEAPLADGADVDLANLNHEEFMQLLARDEQEFQRRREQRNQARAETRRERREQWARERQERQDAFRDARQNARQNAEAARPRRGFRTFLDHRRRRQERR
jgi:hypothetical protein